MLTSAPNATHRDLRAHWTIFAALLLALFGYTAVGYWLGAPLRANADNVEPVFLRSIFYALAIITFPLIKLLRHVSLRLNQTMPTATPPKARYLVSVVISLALAESIGVYGLVLAVLGDSLNSLWIFSGLAVLAMLLYRPRLDEYQDIVNAIDAGQRHHVDVR